MNLQVVYVIDCYYREASPVRCCCENFSSDIQTISLRWFHKQNLIYTDVTNTVKMCVSVLTVTLDKLHQLLKILKLFSWTKNINVKPRWLYRLWFSTAWLAHSSTELNKIFERELHHKNNVGATIEWSIETILKHWLATTKIADKAQRDEDLYNKPHINP